MMTVIMNIDELYKTLTWQVKSSCRCLSGACALLLLRSQPPAYHKQCQEGHQMHALKQFGGLRNVGVSG